MKRDKGEFGYIKSQKIKRGLITLVMFAIPIIIFLTGLFISPPFKKKLIGTV